MPKIVDSYEQIKSKMNISQLKVKSIEASFSSISSLRETLGEHPVCELLVFQSENLVWENTQTFSFNFSLFIDGFISGMNILFLFFDPGLNMLT